MSSAPPTVFCDVHPAALAGWRCEVCSRALCPACAASGLKALPVCAACGHGVATILAPRAVVFPFAKTWSAALASVFTLHAALQILVVSIAVQTFLSLRPGCWLVGRAVQLGWLLFLARRAAVGFDAFGLPRYSDLGSVWLGPLPRFLAGAGPVLLAAAWLCRFGRVAVEASSPWSWLLLGLAVFALPPALVGASVEGDGAAAMWPWRLLPLARALGRDLRPLQVAVAMAALGEIIDGAIAPFSSEDMKLDLHIVQAFVPRWGTMMVLAALGVLAGALVRTRATELGHGEPAEDLVPRLQEPPTGRWNPPAPDPEQVAAEKARRYAPIELDDPLEVIRAAVARRDVDAALAPLRGGHVAPDAIDTAVLVELAQLLAGRGELAQAAQMLRGVAARPPDAHTPRALVILARLCVERLGAVDEGQALYRRVVADFPSTPAAEFARAQLPS